MALATAAAATAASVLGAMYLDAKLLLRNDIDNGVLSGATKSLKFLGQRIAEDKMTVYDDLLRQALSPQGNRNLFLIFEGRTWTYRQFHDDVQRVGNWLMNDLGIQKGELIAINGGNSPEYLMLWFALEAIAAVPVFINCNLTGKSLVHCLTLCEARICLADRDVKNLVDPVEEELRGHGCGIVYYDPDVIAGLADTTVLPQSRRTKLVPFEMASLLFTSGTTGLPKGIRMARAKELNIARSVSENLKLKPGVRMYTCLPLYHGAAHGLAITPSIYGGSTVILGRKFSHKTLWPEARLHKADILQYVGELCRYLVNAPPSSLDKQHNVRMAWGNGMRPDVWEVFRKRFGIETILELYAATDGITGININPNRGDFGKFAVSKRGVLWHLMNAKQEKRIKIDVVTQDIVRDKNGFAIEVKSGEPGEVVTRMDPATQKIAFAGYFNNDEATEKRKTHNLFQKGDLWFRSGDLMRLDSDGCLYFVDRLGDTYRWKSENVSTNEVGDIMGSFDQIAEANVYGVEIPHADGRCGCAAIVMVDGLTEDQFDFNKLAEHVIAALPRYAVPVFVRILKELQYTGTMKLQKGEMRQQGVDLDKMSDNADSKTKHSMYWMPPGKSTYVPFNKKDWGELKAGKVRL